MQIDVEKIASLARLRINPEELEKFQRQMQDILAMVENLPQLDGVILELDVSNPMQLRKDEIIPSLKRDDILKNAPKTEAGCVVVPNTLD